MDRLYADGFRDGLEAAMRVISRMVKDDALRQQLIDKLSYYRDLVSEKRWERIKYELGAFDDLS